MISMIFLIFFVISAIVLAILVLLQDDQGEGLGGLFGGGSGSAFGGASSSVLVKMTGFFGALFILLAIGTAFSFRSHVTDSGVEQAVEELNANDTEKVDEEITSPIILEEETELILTIPEAE